MQNQNHTLPTSGHHHALSAQGNDPCGLLGVGVGSFYRAGALPPDSPALHITSTVRPQVFSVQVLEDQVTEEGGPGSTHAGFQFSGIGLKYKFGPKQCPGSLLLSWGHLWVNETFKEA